MSLRRVLWKTVAVSVGRGFAQADLVRGACATRGASPEAQGSGAPSLAPARRGGTSRNGIFGLACLSVLALGALLGGTASTAGAVAAPCPNEAFRSGFSANLPDCRAYELVTPENTGGVAIKAVGGLANSMGAGAFDLFPVSDSGGSLSVTFVSEEGALPGFDGTGTTDRYQSLRGENGWTTRLIGPTPDQMEGVDPSGISSDHAYSFLQVQVPETDQGSLSQQGSHWVRYPDGTFKPMGLGELGTDPNPCGRYISPGGRHIIFDTGDRSCGGNLTSPVQLLADAPPNGTRALYDRTPSGLHTISLLPGDVTPTESAWFQGVSADGSVVLFSIGTGGDLGAGHTLYARIGDAETLAVASGNTGTVTPAGVSAEGLYVFYVQNGNVYSFNTQTEATTTVVNTGDAELVNISGDGSHVYFVSHMQIGGKGSAGQPNLYVWGRGTGSTAFIATVSPADLSGNACLTCWMSQAVTPGQTKYHGPGNDLSRTTPDGGVIVFQSHANLTSYNAGGHSEIYRYDAAGGGSPLCVSCNPSGAPATSDASLTNFKFSVLEGIVSVANITDDGQMVFFQTSDALVAADTNGAQDVYEWKADGSGGCNEAAGCVSLISSGTSPLITQGGKETPTNFLYGVSSDGHDVFILTGEQLLPQDRSDGSGAIYDVRIGGGFPAPAAAGEACSEDACQGESLSAPGATAPGSLLFSGMGNLPAPVVKKPVVKRLTNAQKLARALKACKKRRKRQRGKCESQARKRYGKKASKSGRSK